jgi:hypothetical protein
MKRRQKRSLIHEGDYAAEVPVETIEDDTAWSPYLSPEDAAKLDIVRAALKRGDVTTASQHAHVFNLVPVGSPQAERPSDNYELFREALLKGKQIVCRYKGYRRELCPVIVGHSDGKEKVLAYQFAGDSSSHLPPGGEWRCLDLFEVTDALMREGPWHEGKGHATEQRCVKEVDLDINIHVRKLRAPAG